MNYVITLGGGFSFVLTHLKQDMSKSNQNHSPFRIRVKKSPKFFGKMGQIPKRSISTTTCCFFFFLTVMSILFAKDQRITIIAKTHPRPNYLFVVNHQFLLSRSRPNKRARRSVISSDGQVFLRDSVRFRLMPQNALSTKKESHHQP